MLTNISVLMNEGHMPYGSPPASGPATGDGILLEDGTSFLLLEDGSSFILLE